MSRIEFTANRVCIGQSSDSERAHDQWQCAAVTLQVNLSFPFVSSVSNSKQLIEHYTELIVGIIVSAIAFFRRVDNNIMLFSSLHC